MNNPKVNFTITQSFINLTTPFNGPINPVELCMSGISLLLGLPLHSYVVWLIITQSGISSDFFSLNLSVCEVCVCLNNFFSLLSLWFSSMEMLVLFLSGLGITGRPLFLCLICVERYLAVIHPVTFLKLKPLRYKAIFSTAAWTISLGFCSSCMFILVSFKIYVYAWFFSVPLVLFFSIKLFCCVAVLKSLKQSGPGERGREREKENHIKKRAFRHILIVTVCMVVIYLPFILVGFMIILSNLFFPALWLLGVVFYGLSAFFQPVLLLLRYGKLPCFPKP